MEDTYSKVESLIIWWSIDGTQTAGTLTRWILDVVSGGDMPDLPLLDPAKIQPEDQVEELTDREIKEYLDFCPKEMPEGKLIKILRDMGLSIRQLFMALKYYKERNKTQGL